MKINKNQIPAFMIIFHLVGLIGFMIPYFHDIFKLLVPFHLCLMTILVIWGYAKNTQKLALNFIILFGLGFFIEVLGVHTQLIFGNYHYGNTLGVKLWAVPLTMGLNWFLLVYAIGDLVQKVKLNYPLKIMVSAFLMVGIDYFIEPVAQKFDYWHWSNGIVPFQNYIAWFIVSMGMFALYFQQPLTSQNHKGTVLFFSQMVFFIVLRLFL